MPQNSRSWSSRINDLMFGDNDALKNLPVPKNLSLVTMGGFACLAWSVGNTIALYVHPHYNTDTSPREDMIQYLNEVLEINSLVIFGSAIGFGAGYLIQLSFRNYALNTRSLQADQLIESLLKLPGVYFLPGLVLKTAYDAIFINHGSDAVVDYSGSSSSAFAGADDSQDYTTTERVVAAPVLLASGYAAFRFAASGMGGLLKRMPGVNLINWDSAIANTPKVALAATTMTISLFAAQSAKEEYEDSLGGLPQKLVVNMAYDFVAGAVGAAAGALAYDAINAVGQKCCVNFWNLCIKGQSRAAQESDRLLQESAALYRQGINSTV